ncbi:PadR family transcriptional regulator [Amycolatopsis vastitatis]|uniref:PadR family transcriptional regulator n=1 Tax=Amycolatopsis vastitatis TaxID=1905142 RepID=A0A229T459_9PSEU|nr:helix-turn-helix transcriptional regulator [Amycolatopsis vastitatis]OXM65863.1 PadR family transcriptional regulator [Amycolatopsis vastitatis]
MASRGQLSPVAIAVLALLAEEPMHAYRMQQLMRERGVGLVVNVRNRSGLHASLDRLARDELIRVRAVERDARHPERTVYELTAPGRETLLAGLRDHVATPAREFPLFPAVVSFLHLLSPEDARARLELRAEALQRRLTVTEAVLTASREYGVPRLHLLEHEYLETTTSAELAWVRAVSRDIGAGDLTWEPYA